jgi:hypothetical protein
MAMAVTTSTTPSREPTTRSTAAASKDLQGTASEHVASSGKATEAGGDMLQTASRMIYSGSYALAYGLVYAVVFVVQMVPQENPVMHGFRDGGKAAMDELGQS